MRKSIKSPDSKILKDGLSYKVNGNNSKISQYLFEEQKGFCAYTETYLGRTDKKDIDHFDPSLKGKPTDNYNNWFLIKSQWNSEKSNKWEKFQPVLHPTDIDFESRIVYDNGDFVVANQDDSHAINLLNLINLNDAKLSSHRKKYIRRKKDEIKKYGVSPSIFFKMLIEDDLDAIKYIRAIKEEFDVDILEIINQI